MTRRVFLAICTVAFAVFLCCFVLIMGALHSYFSQVQMQQLRDETRLVAHALTAQGGDYFEELTALDCRITWISASGQVLYDSDFPPEQLENHLLREEVLQALNNGSGESTRRSDTAGEYTLYCARLLPDGTIVRLSATYVTLLTLVLSMAQPICVILAVVIVLALFLAFRLSRQVMKPLNELNLDQPLVNPDYEELTPLLRRIDSQQKQLRYQSWELSMKKTEFDTVTNHMTEGLVLLSGKGIILSINHAASRQLNIGLSSCGKDFLALAHEEDIRELVRQALFGKHCQQNVTIGEQTYLVNANPVHTDSMVSGVVLLLMDVTEKLQAETIRREFTANVSHELKTPLHVISGYAELLQSGMVQSEDVTGFSGKIYSEAQRLIRLVEDILRLSRLDEGTEEAIPEPVELLALAQEVAGSFSVTAAQAQVTLSVDGSPAVIRGIPHQLSAIISNLCSNAIKYNRPGGSVRVLVESQETHAVLTVSDTGIGIPAEHQRRIFERFYRVDKSHSKAVGGTGLGLSIVKHAAAAHQGEIQLRSIPGEGTSISIRFPLSQP